MVRRFLLLISSGCTALLVLVPAAALYFLFNIDSFAVLARSSFALPLRWQTIDGWQWYALWLITLGFVSIGLAGLDFLRRAFANFAAGELFNMPNSRDLRRFSVLLLAQGVAKPLHFTLSSVLLSWNHPADEKVPALSVGSGELNTIALAIIMWVMSALLVEGCDLQAENRQFV